MVELTIGILCFLFVSMVIYLTIEYIRYKPDQENKNNLDDYGEKY